MKTPAALDPQRKFRMDRDGFGLATLLDDILSFDSGLFEKIKSEFCNYFPQFTGIRLRTEIGVSRDNGALGSYGATERAGKGIYLVGRGREARASKYPTAPFCSWAYSLSRTCPSLPRCC